MPPPNKSKEAASPEKKVALDRKKIQLNFRGLSEDAINSIAAETLGARGRVPAPTEPKIGDNAVPRIGAVMPDGTIYAGVSPDTGQRMYAAAADVPLALTFNEAADYAAGLHVHGHQDWRVPTKDELNVLFNNRAAIGGFNVTGSDLYGWYWSSSQGYGWNAWCQDFGAGFSGEENKAALSSLRPVR